MIDGALGPGKKPAISIFYGLPGSGKSLTISEIQVDWRERGLPVITNLEIKAMPFRLRKRQWGEYIYLDETAFHLNPIDGRLNLINIVDDVRLRNPGKHILVVLDEIQTALPPELWKENAKKIGSFVEQHRKSDASVIFASQTYSSVDVSIRRRAAEFRHHSNLAGDTMLRWFVFFFTDNIHKCVCYAPTLKNEPNPKAVLGTKIIWLTKRNTAYYDTLQFHGKDAGRAGGLRKGAALSKRLTVLGMVVFLLYVFGSFLWTMGSAAFASSPSAAKVVHQQPIPVETATIDSSWVQGDIIVDSWISDSGLEFQTTSTLVDLWQLEDRVGQTTQIPAVRGRPVFEILQGTYKHAF